MTPLPEKDIKCSSGIWINELGWRGLREVWRLNDGPINIAIEMFDCDDGDWEILLFNDDTGDVDYLGFGSFTYCDNAAKKFMNEYVPGDE